MPLFWTSTEASVLPAIAIGLPGIKARGTIAQRFRAMALLGPLAMSKSFFSAYVWKAV